jgi:MFS family permease
MTVGNPRSARDVPTIWSRGFVFVLVINLVINIAQYMMIALVPKFAESLGASSVTVGVVTGIFAVTALAVRPVVGPATFRFRKNILLGVTVVIILLAFVCYSFADSIPLLITGRLLHGIGMGFLAPIALVLASETLPESKMASGISVFSLGQAVAMAAGPSIGLALEQALNYRATFLISAGVMIVALAMSVGITSGPPLEKKGAGFSWNRLIATEALLPAAVIFLLAGAYSAVNSFIVLYGEALGVAEIGLFFTAYAISMLISRPIAGRVADRFGLSAVIIPGIVLFGAAFVMISCARTLPAFVIAGVISSLGYGVCQPAIQSLALLAVDKDRRGVAGSTNYMGVDLAYLVMPIAAGSVVSAVQSHGTAVTDAYSVMFLVMIIPVLLGLGVYVAFTRRKAR